MVNSVFDSILKKENTDILSHAFILETNDESRCMIELLETIKKMICPNNFASDCKFDCNLCYQIDKNSLPSLLIISPEGSYIKKSQVLELKERLQTKPVYTKNNFYIIKGSDRLNSSSANTMLKFIEEPNDNIIGFFITDNREKIIDTIRSRCQIFKVDYNLSGGYQQLGVTSEKYSNLLVILHEYLLSIEELNCLSILKSKYLSTVMADRVDYEYFFKLMLNIYVDKLNYLINDKIEMKYLDFNFILESNELIKIKKKIYVIKTALNDLKFNPNLELLFDRISIEMRRV